MWLRLLEASNATLVQMTHFILCLQALNTPLVSFFSLGSGLWLGVCHRMTLPLLLGQVASPVSLVHCRALYVLALAGALQPAPDTGTVL